MAEQDDKGNVYLIVVIYELALVIRLPSDGALLWTFSVSKVSGLETVKTLGVVLGDFIHWHPSKIHKCGKKLSVRTGTPQKVPAVQWKEPPCILVKFFPFSNWPYPFDSPLSSGFLS